MDSSTGNRLAFEAQITGVKPILAKAAPNGYSSQRGASVELTLMVTAPTPPHEPSPPYQWSDRQAADGWKPRPEGVERKKGESDDKFADRESAARFQQRQWDEARVRWSADMERWRAEVATLRARMRAYTLLVGLTTVLGGQVVKVDLEPSVMQDLLMPDAGLPELPGGEG